jgi:hypothetical protein
MITSPEELKLPASFSSLRHLSLSNNSGNFAKFNPQLRQLREV